MTYLRGIDISRHQGDIDWPRVAPNIDVVIIRATLGATGIDDRYRENWRELGWAGIKRRGVYHYYVTEVEPLSQLANLLRTTGGDFGTEPVVIDCERRADEKLKPFDKAAYTANLRKFLLALDDATQSKIMIYTSAEEWKNITTLPGWVSGLGLHVAGYPFDPNSATYKPAVPPPWPTWQSWQFSSTGRVSGIAGNCDLNRVKPDTEPEPAPPPVPDGRDERIAALAQQILGEL